jgi:hypothetical protein
VSRKSFKQKTMTDSIAKVEYTSTSKVIKKIVWIMKLIIKLGVSSNIVDPIALYCNNNLEIHE